MTKTEGERLGRCLGTHANGQRAVGVPRLEEPWEVQQLMIEIKWSVWQSPDLEVVTELKSDQEMTGRGTRARESFTAETKEEIRKLQSWTQENRTICQSSGVREKGAETGTDWGGDGSRDGLEIKDRSRDGVETGLEME